MHCCTFLLSLSLRKSNRYNLRIKCSSKTHRRRLARLRLRMLAHPAGDAVTSLACSCTNRIDQRDRSEIFEADGGLRKFVCGTAAVDVRSTRCGRNKHKGARVRTIVCERVARMWHARMTQRCDARGGEKAGCSCIRPIYVKSRMLIPIAMHATDTHGLNRSPMRAHFQNVPRKLKHSNAQPRSRERRARHRVSGRTRKPGESHLPRLLLLALSSAPIVSNRCAPAAGFAFACVSLTPFCVRRARSERMCAHKCRDR